MTFVDGREDAVVRALVDIAAGLAEDGDVQELLHRLAEHCVALVDSAACGIMLTDPRGSLKVVAAHPEAGRILDLLQLQVDEGPCVDCVRTGQRVGSGDLELDGDRWPRWSRLAREEGFRSVYATPVRYHEQVIGTLNIFGRTAFDAPERDLLLVRALADVAAVTILRQRGAVRADRLNSQLRGALESRIALEEAKGVVAQSLDISMDEAFDRLRRFARHSGIRLGELAVQIVGARVKPADLILATGEGGPAA